MTDFEKQSALDLIRSNIASHGHHVYVVAGGGPMPRFAYTIGAKARIGVELILAGASIFQASEATQIVNTIARALSGDATQWSRSINVAGLGSFSLRQADPSWTSGLMLGALDYHNAVSLPALQIVPDKVHWTIDIPELEKPWSASEQPVWQWLYAPWTLDIPSTSTATTNLDALRGRRVTEAARWEENEWELFAGAGPDVAPDDARVIPLGTLLATDASLLPVTRLDVGRALWREADESGWHNWG